jgi:S1-C subfamily serine protease
MKRIKLIAVILIAFTTISYGATYSLVSAAYPINVNGQKIAVQPLNLNGTTYLPLRSISEAVGVPIEWTGKSVEITTLDLDRLKEASVMIYADDGKTQVQGSGVYTDYGEVTSAFHLIADNRTNLKTSEGDKLTVDETSQGLDIMTLDSSDDIKPVKIGDSDEVKVGDKVIVVGAPDGKNDSIIYARVKQITNEIVIDVAVNGGGSGGALFTIDGQFIGTLVAADFGLKETYVTPINSIRKAL